MPDYAQPDRRLPRHCPITYTAQSSITIVMPHEGITEYSRCLGRAGHEGPHVYGTHIWYTTDEYNPDEHEPRASTRTLRNPVRNPTATP